MRLRPELENCILIEMLLHAKKFAENDSKNVASGNMTVMKTNVRHRRKCHLFH